MERISKIYPTQYIYKDGKWQVSQEGFVLYEENGILYTKGLQHFYKTKEKTTLLQKLKKYIRGEE